MVMQRNEYQCTAKNDPCYLYDATLNALLYSLCFHYIFAGGKVAANAVFLSSCC